MKNQKRKVDKLKKHFNFYYLEITPDTKYPRYKQLEYIMTKFYDTDTYTIKNANRAHYFHGKVNISNKNYKDYLYMIEV